MISPSEAVDLQSDNMQLGVKPHGPQELRIDGPEALGAVNGKDEPTNLFHGMAPISLQEMDNVRLMNRVDTKYVFAEELLPDILDAIRSDYRVLEIDGVALSPYETLYFDSEDHDCFIQHQNGKLNRHKFRMRSYLSTGVSFLEIKAKNNKGRTDKRRIPIAKIAEKFSPEALDFLNETMEQSRKETPDLTPQMWTNFTRVTLVGHEGQERATLDFNLEFRYEDRSQPLSGVVIAEVKQARDDRYSPLREALRQLNVRPMRISKYCLGSTLLKPHLKSNRFKEKLRAIGKLSATGY